VTLEIRPEPSDEEREALVVALRELEESRRPAPGDAWRRAALEEAD
jgi:hypothetical protein